MNASATTLSPPQESQTTVPSAMPEPGQRARMSYAAYLALSGEDRLYEWVDGEVIVPMPPKPLHQQLVLFLANYIQLFCKLTAKGQVFVAPIEVKLWPDGPSREPDILFISDEHIQERVAPERIVGPPDLIIEIVSSDSVHRDRVDKFDEYEQAGVREYWIIDNRPERQQAWFFRRGEHGQFERVIVGEGGVYHSQVLAGFWLRLSWLWEERPDELRALAEVLGSERVMEALQQRS